MKREKIAMFTRHQVLLAAILAGRARWERLGEKNSRVGEVCFNGLRYCVHLDEWGFPDLDDHLCCILREDLRKHCEESGVIA